MYFSSSVRVSCRSWSNGGWTVPHTAHFGAWSRLSLNAVSRLFIRRLMFAVVIKMELTGSFRRSNLAHVRRRLARSPSVNDPADT